MLAKFGTNSGGITWWSKFELIQVLKWIQIQYSWKDNSSYKLYTLGPLCLWQCFEYFPYTHGAKAHCQRGWMVCDPSVAIIFLSSLTHGLIFPCYPVHGPAIKIFAGASRFICFKMPGTLHTANPPKKWKLQVASLQHREVIKKKNGKEPVRLTAWVDPPGVRKG